MKALVTGGAGFIGSNLVQGLLDEKHKVVILDNMLSGHEQNIIKHDDVTFVKGDIRDENLVMSSMEDIDVVFHFAASVGNKRSIDFPKDDASINVLGTLNILEAMRKHNVPKIVASSSAGIYGELKLLPIKENHPIEPFTPYASTKLCMEKQCLSYAHLYDIDAVCLRYFNVYGLNQRFDAYGNVIPIFAHRLINGQPITIFGDGEQTRDFVNVKDVVQANLKGAFAPKGVSGAFNVATGKGLSINRLASMLKEYSGLDGEIQYAPVRMGDVLHSDADISAARESFGFDPVVQIEEGLKEYMDWAMDNLKLK